jgi:hypothetical protein
MNQYKYGSFCWNTVWRSVVRMSSCILQVLNLPILFSWSCTLIRVQVWSNIFQGSSLFWMNKHQIKQENSKIRRAGISFRFQKLSFKFGSGGKRIKTVNRMLPYVSVCFLTSTPLRQMCLKCCEGCHSYPKFFLLTRMLALIIKLTSWVLPSSLRISF